MRHNKRHVKLTRVVVAISFNLDAVAFGDNEHNELGNSQHHVLMVILIKAHVALLVEWPLILNVFDDVLVLNAPIAIDIELVFNALLVVINLDDAFDFEHTDQQVLEEPDLDLLLDNDEQSVVQLEDNLVDLVDRWHNHEHCCPPLGRRRLEMPMGICCLTMLHRHEM